MIERSRPKVLLIDNTVKEEGKKNHRIKRLEDTLRSYPVKVVTIRYEDLPGIRTIEKGFDRMVLSGSGMNISDPMDRGKVGMEIDLVRDSPLPILGICFGFHLVLYAFGCKVMRNPDSTEFLLPNGRDITVHVDGDEGGIMGNGEHPVNVSHRDYVPPDDPVLIRDFSVRSVSRDGGSSYVQYAKHRTRHVHAVQFHPEAYDNAPESVLAFGTKVINGFIRTSKGHI
ncbi:MAG: gamma-glutamyl-gamma-aminobutyrate hydrolase family protein [Candidatus Thermoplasmatota archaeon]|jgi:GMP synthase-like glutamine amidotransferase|nr:gamma-glutamyl-gamma-aminobutyrate hydrolase family protein [Candidatus Thermoplasmatota archaeon]